MTSLDSTPLNLADIYQTFLQNTPLVAAHHYDVKYSEKIYKIHNDLCCSVSGITSDANVLINELRLIAQRYR